jgi:hypothetical protein
MITLVTGTIFLMWLGEQITERGIGNGISMIILAGIVAGLPAAIAGTADLVRNGEMSPVTAILILVGGIAAIIFVVYMERAQRRITVNYARRQQGRRMCDDRELFRWPGGRAECAAECSADNWREPESRAAGVRSAVRGDDYFLLLLLHRFDVQLEGHSGQFEAIGRIRAGYPTWCAYGRVH